MEQKKNDIDLYKKISYLLQGSMLNQYKLNKCYSRKFWVNLVFDKILWNPKDRNNGKSITLSSLVSIIAGKHMQFQDFSSDVREEDALTLIFSDHCMCLEASNQAMRNNWVAALKFIIRLHHGVSGGREAFYFWYCQNSDLPLKCDATDANIKISVASVATSNISLTSSYSNSNSNNNGNAVSETQTRTQRLKRALGLRTGSSPTSPTTNNNGGNSPQPLPKGEILYKLLTDESKAKSFSRFLEDKSALEHLKFVKEVDDYRRRKVAEAQNIHTKFLKDHESNRSTSVSNVWPKTSNSQSMMRQLPFKIKSQPIASLNKPLTLAHRYVDETLIPQWQQHQTRNAKLKPAKKK